METSQRLSYKLSELEEALQRMITSDQQSNDADDDSMSAVSNELLVYDEDGDLTIRVGPSLSPFRVDSKTVSRSSLVFRRMLFGGFAESRPTDGSDWVVDLPDDGRDSMEILFGIIHGAFERVPTELSLWSLYDLLVHTEKYDATRLLRPWAKLWLHNQEVVSQTEEPELLCVAWELGDSALFKQMLHKITNECLIDNDGNVVYGRRKRIQKSHNGNSYYRVRSPELVLNSLDHLMPPDIEEIISSNRQKIVNAELQPYVDLWNLCIMARCESHSTYPEKGWKCDSMVLGSLIKSLFDAHVHIASPKAAVEGYRGSLADLRTRLDRARVRSMCGDECDEGIQTALEEGKEKAAELRADIMTLQDSHKEYMESQARKTGL
ncbi:hypothetical protein CGRA01v4_00442 [Colletotrichum graminicola]|uniref:BTB domain-containing protein n=1 Tax=Colletotrichum graminicola (strain M1.001 / M2 / FGSC 10212) TaxID=645133 RepID=E3QH12_COLGM|nr:uncharacterized protein GLRG_05318 [Colletotrichum graminicola M1.001]EFQ30174.1 hypothetical protein GLRG_05318 [Colletotrichum graminicola M1.001]WDK09164.1 hypothetical protein CGRA01v4_00442 [Colletotrichum graminicola]